MSIGSNTLNTELNRGHDSFMRQLAAMWVWIRDLEKKQNESAEKRCARSRKPTDEGA